MLALLAKESREYKNIHRTLNNNDGHNASAISQFADALLAI